MRSLAVALASALLAGGAAYAHGRLTTDGPQAAGTMTCSVRGDTSLVFGRSPVADCAFAPADGGAPQRYVALFARGRDLPRAQTVAWRVTTPGGVAPTGLLDGRFAAGAEGRLAKDGGIVLTPLRGSARSTGMVLDRPGVAFATVPETMAAR